MEHVDAQETERKGRKKTKREMRKEYRIVTFLAAAASLLTVLYPLLPKGLYMGTDAPFHLARIESLYLALKEGVFLPRFISQRPIRSVMGVASSIRRGRGNWA